MGFSIVLPGPPWDALEQNVPSPLAGEGQGEGEAIAGERSEQLNQAVFGCGTNAT